jgi:hypothetical protein
VRQPACDQPFDNVFVNLVRTTTNLKRHFSGQTLGGETEKSERPDCDVDRSFRQRLLAVLAGDAMDHLAPRKTVECCKRNNPMDNRDCPESKQ